MLLYQPKGPSMGHIRQGGAAHSPVQGKGLRAQALAAVIRILQEGKQSVHVNLQMSAHEDKPKGRVGNLISTEKINKKQCTVLSHLEFQ